MVEWGGSGVGWAGGTVEMLVKGWVISAGRSNILKRRTLQHGDHTWQQCCNVVIIASNNVFYAFTLDSRLYFLPGKSMNKKYMVISSILFILYHIHYVQEMILLTLQQCFKQMLTTLELIRV